MSLYFFRISHGRYSGASDQPNEFENRDAAWAEMTRGLRQPARRHRAQPEAEREWRMELLDEAKKPVFRVRLVANLSAWPSREVAPWRYVALIVTPRVRLSVNHAAISDQFSP